MVFPWDRLLILLEKTLKSKWKIQVKTLKNLERL